MQLRGLDHLTLRVSELVRSERFYCTVLGCSVERRSETAGLVQLRAGDSLIDLAAVDGPIGRPGGAPPGSAGRNLDHFCLRVADFDEATIVAELATHGVDVEATTTHAGAEGIGRSIYIRDPDANQIELKGPARQR